MPKTFYYIGNPIGDSEENILLRNIIGGSDNFKSGDTVYIPLCENNLPKLIKATIVVENQNKYYLKFHDDPCKDTLIHQKIFHCRNIVTHNEGLKAIPLSSGGSYPIKNSQGLYSFILSLQRRCGCAKYCKFSIRDFIHTEEISETAHGYLNRGVLDIYKYCRRSPFDRDVLNIISLFGYGKHTSTEWYLYEFNLSGDQPPTRIYENTEMVDLVRLKYEYLIPGLAISQISGPQPEEPEDKVLSIGNMELVGVDYKCIYKNKNWKSPYHTSVVKNTEHAVDDCNTHIGMRVTLTKKNYKTFIGRYLMTNKEHNCILLTEDNVDSYLDSDVIIRSPIYCNNRGTVCRICKGEIYNTAEILTAECDESIPINTIHTDTINNTNKYYNGDTTPSTKPGTILPYIGVPQRATFDPPHPETEKEPTMTFPKSLMQNNKDAVAQAMQIEAGRIATTVITEMATPKLPPLLQLYVKHPAASLLLANLVTIGVEQFRPNDPKAQYIAEAMRVSAYTELFKSFSLEKLITEVFAKLDDKICIPGESETPPTKSKK